MSDRARDGEAADAPGAGFVQSNGLRLHYLSWYPASGGHAGFPQLVMLHATGFLARLWQPVARRLAAAHHVIAFDSRGHGDSDRPDPCDELNYRWLRLAEDLRGFLDALGLWGIPAIGHSAGGAAAAYVAATHPQYFSRLVLVEPIIIPTEMLKGARGNQMAEAARRRREVWTSPEEMIESYRGRPPFTRWTEEALRLYAEHGTFRREDGQYQLKCPGEVEARMFENSDSLDVWGLLPRITCPATVIKGQHTDPFLGKMAEAVAARIPDGRHVTVPDAGHLVPMEQPQAVADLVLEFLG